MDRRKFLKSLSGLIAAAPLARFMPKKRGWYSDRMSMKLELAKIDFYREMDWKIPEETWRYLEYIQQQMARQIGLHDIAKMQHSLMRHSLQRESKA